MSVFQIFWFLCKLTIALVLLILVLAFLYRVWGAITGRTTGNRDTGTITDGKVKLHP